MLIKSVGGNITLLTEIEDLNKSCMWLKLKLSNITDVFPILHCQLNDNPEKNQQSEGTNGEVEIFQSIYEKPKIFHTISFSLAISTLACQGIRFIYLFLEFAEACQYIADIQTYSPWNPKSSFSSLEGQYKPAKYQTYSILFTL